MGAYRNFAEQLLSTYMAGKTVKAMFVSDAYVPDYDNHSLVSDISAFEASGIGYTSGGYVLAATVTTDVGEVRLVVPNIALTGATVVLGGAVFYLVETGELMALDMFAEPITIDAGEFTYNAPPEGVVALVSGA